jgi:hypothetical protein
MKCTDTADDRLGVLNEKANLNQRLINMTAEELFSCKRDDPSQ